MTHVLHVSTTPQHLPVTPGMRRAAAEADDDEDDEDEDFDAEANEASDSEDISDDADASGDAEMVEEEGEEAGRNGLGWVGFAGTDSGGVTGWRGQGSWAGSWWGRLGTHGRWGWRSPGRSGDQARKDGATRSRDTRIYVGCCACCHVVQALRLTRSRRAPSGRRRRAARMRSQPRSQRSRVSCGVPEMGCPRRHDLRFRHKHAAPLRDTGTVWLQSSSGLLATSAPLLPHVRHNTFAWTLHRIRCARAPSHLFLLPCSCEACEGGGGR